MSGRSVSISKPRAVAGLLRREHGCWAQKKFLFALAVALTLVPTFSLAQEPYFKGKTIRIIAGFPGGGGVDAESRMIARFLPAHIPGNPAVIVQNMPGAGGTVASNWFEQFAKPDGLTLHYTSTTSINQQAMGVKEAKHDLRHWPMIGSVRRGTSVSLIRKPSIPRLTGSGEPLKVGVRSGDESWNAMFLWGAEFLKWNVRWVQGYPGGGDIQLAFERNETDIYPTATLPVLRKFVGQGFYPFIQQVMLTATGAFQRRAEFPDVPVFEDLAKEQRPTGVPWQAYLIWAGSDSIGRPLNAAPKTSAELTRTLRDAFARMKEGTDFKAELKRVSGDDAQILTGEEAEQLLKQILVVSPEIQELTSNLMKKYLGR
jgi:tripartite-type tricarboxylate transporter receptor subunit TctC